MRSSTSDVRNRRSFLLTTASASAAGLAALTAPIRDAQAYDPGPSETGARYRETDHVRAFYQTNGYEGVKR